MLDLEAIKDRLAAATPGPWTASPNVQPRGVAAVATVNTVLVLSSGPLYGSPMQDASLIAHAPTDLAALVAEVERLRDEKSNYEADRLDCARQINDLSRKVEDLQHANISLKNTMDIRVAAPPSTLAKLHAEVKRLRAAIEDHQRTVKPGDDYCGADVILWRAIDA